MLSFGNIGQISTGELGEIASSRGLIGAVIEGYEDKATPGDPIQIIVVDKSTIPYIDSNGKTMIIDAYIGLKIKDGDYDFQQNVSTPLLNTMELIYIFAFNLTKIVRLPTVQ